MTRCLRREEVLFGDLTNVTDMDIDDVNVYWIAGRKVSLTYFTPRRQTKTVFSANYFYHRRPVFAGLYLWNLNSLPTYYCAV